MAFKSLKSVTFPGLDDPYIVDQVGSGADAIYAGVDLTERFAEEIANYSDVWAWIQARKKAGNYADIHVGDYIPFTTTNGTTLTARIAGMDTYTNYGDSAVGHHIDFICDELWPTLHPVNPYNYNNGLIPVESVTSDGETTSFTLTKEMDGISSITLSGETLSDYTYDASTFTITFTSAPAAGTMTVTGTGTKYPWLASDLYHWLNSLSGQVPNGTGLNPAVKHVDYTADGVYYYLPDALKSVIITKRFLLEQRYSASGILSTDNTWGWENLGKLWVPTEAEVYGMPVWSGTGYGDGGSAVQYPLFAHSMRRAKKRNGSRYSWWLLSPFAGATTYWCYVSNSGYAYANNASNAFVAAPICFRI